MADKLKSFVRYFLNLKYVDLTNLHTQDIKILCDLKMNTSDIFELLIGAGIGFIGAKNIANKTGPVKIYGKRVHHYNLLAGVPFVKNNFTRGLLIGAALEDWKDLIKDITSLFIDNNDSNTLPN